MVDDSSVSTCEKEVNAIYRAISYNTNQLCERMLLQLRVVDKLYKYMILGFDLLQSVNQYIDRVNFSVTL